MAEEEPAEAGIPDPDVHGGALKRQLGVWDLIAYGLASTLGTGILVTVGDVAKHQAGPAVVFCFLLAGFAAFLSALCYSEFASRIPVSGSAYSFAYITLGELVGWFVGWNLTLEYAISASAVARGWTGYFVSALKSVGVHVPGWLYEYKITSFLSVSLISAVVVLGCTGLLLFGMKESARFNAIMTTLNVGIIFFVIICGAFYVDTSNWTPFAPHGVGGVYRGVGMVFFSYIGFDSVSTLAGEVKRPGRDLPIGIVGTLLTVTALYIAVSLVLTGMVNYTDLDVDAPLSDAFKHVGAHWAASIVAFGSLTTMSATTLASLVGQPRIFFQMSKDGLIFKLFSKVNPKTGVPVEGTLITGVVSAVIALFLDIDILVNMISIGTLLAFTVVCGGVIVLRYQSDNPAEEKKAPLMTIAYFIGCIIFSARVKIPIHGVSTAVNVVTWLVFAIPAVATFIPLLLQKQTNIPEKFKCPLVPWVPCLGILMNVWFIANLDIDSIYRLVIWTSIGMAIYFLYGIRHSNLAHSPRN